MQINHPDRHSRVGGNPVQLFNMQFSFARYAESFYMPDSRLRENDAGG